MRLMAKLSARLAAEASYFRQHLIREDIARLERLTDMAQQCPAQDAFVAAALKIGWTPADSRTHELRPALVPLLEAIHASSVRGFQAGLDDEIERCWSAFETLRMDRLVGCLSRVPRPSDMGTG